MVATRKIETTEACQKNWTEIVSIAQPFRFIHEMTLNIEQNRNRVQTKLHYVLINDLKCNIWRIITLSTL